MWWLRSSYSFPITRLTAYCFWSAKTENAVMAKTESAVMAKTESAVMAKTESAVMCILDC